MNGNVRVYVTWFTCQLATCVGSFMAVVALIICISLCDLSVVGGGAVTARTREPCAFCLCFPLPFWRGVQVAFVLIGGIIQLKFIAETSTSAAPSMLPR